MSGFWKAPRALQRLVAEGNLTRTEFAVVVYVGLLGADRPGGVSTSIGALADSLGYGKKTVRLALRRLRELGLLDFADHERVPGFTLRTTAALAGLAETPLGGWLGKSETAVTPPATPPEPGPTSDRKPASLKASAGEVPQTPETETETERKETSKEKSSEEVDLDAYTRA